MPVISLPPKILFFGRRGQGELLPPARGPEMDAAPPQRKTEMLRADKNTRFIGRKYNIPLIRRAYAFLSIGFHSPKKARRHFRQCMDEWKIILFQCNITPPIDFVKGFDEISAKIS
ncbi:MAG: hypothetical protein LJU34_03370 [Oscillospiraceae bacterium]|nr:hypothetical protein [Oscillospiraceae bacterium]